ncbi:ribonuclease P protein component [Corynebacterium sp. MC-04]|uniref:Ribonuclease P protein component n=1 Tax=Corynebacterium parakroppenstedtii TaxID=2828363 RepID=A0ABS9HJT5_9CORY|nr:ribonuclease P protein component [Corynebacterium parakroppenstedtii]MCZ9301986.1 ribonuclease P protein component [Corynebacterium sp. c24U_166]UWY22071.1 ribonuclease P protein component [Corynebacterium kroppenstedtii]MBY0788759.1 ribonuclease P protein component [Corynebacterium parakroppenstedtii]MBY0792821.1 ribonuclease P protein component [Corynebacterium parakroppenstedtii]MCF6770177.1 ribonuclease P protein component [Corynebacterium parakroppenstedtii]
MFPASQRLRHRSDFRAAIRGATSGSKLVVVHVVIRSSDPATADLINGPRVGVVCSKSVGNSVVRHTVARHLRHVAKNLVDDLPRNVDLVIRARPAAANASHSALAEAVTYCTNKAYGKARRREAKKAKAKKSES